MIAYFHGDMDLDVMAGNNSQHIPCILETSDFASCFLFSLETQHTIGYGTRQSTTECPEAMLVVSLQAVLGCLIQAFMVGLVFSKLQRPRNRSKTIIFSHHAVINLRDRKLCLVIRWSIQNPSDRSLISGSEICAMITSYWAQRSR
jgi:potassium inwardly-rectifying channel subfamily J